MLGLSPGGFLTGGIRYAGGTSSLSEGSLSPGGGVRAGFSLGQSFFLVVIFVWRRYVDYFSRKWIPIPWKKIKWRWVIRFSCWEINV